MKSLKKGTNNSTTFAQFDRDASLFYRANGWVVIKGRLSETTCQELFRRWEILCERYCRDIGCSPTGYHQVISQWRDLWKADQVFADVLQTSFANLAAASFELSGVQLLHDHIICKSLNGGNGTIPWHQDSMYWPVDRTGVSTWMSLVDVPISHGCLEVVNGSHHWPAAQPVDFMSESSPLAENTPTVHIPVNAGDVVLLHSRTWHRSLPTEAAGMPRPAYITLWVPTGARYWPKNAQWHPLNEQISVPENAYLNEDEFPIFGQPSKQLGNSIENKHEGTPITFGMFDAKSRAQKQIEQLLGVQGSLSELLRDQSQRRTLAERLITKNIETSNNKPIDLTIDAVWISAASFERHRARNVFNSAYKDWEDLTKDMSFDAL